MNLFNMLKNIRRKGMAHSDANLKEAKDYTDSALQNAITFKGMTDPSMYTNNMMETGIWLVGGRDTIPDGLVDTFVWSLFIVIHHPDSGMVHQYIINPQNSGKDAFLMRSYVGNPGAWGVWKYATISNWYV